MRRGVDGACIFDVYIFYKYSAERYKKYIVSIDIIKMMSYFCKK